MYGCGTSVTQSKTNTHRRTFLKAAGAGSALPLAGCTSNGAEEASAEAQPRSQDEGLDPATSVDTDRARHDRRARKHRRDRDGSRNRLGHARRAVRDVVYGLCVDDAGTGGHARVGRRRGPVRLGDERTPGRHHDARRRRRVVGWARRLLAGRRRPKPPTEACACPFWGPLQVRSSSETGSSGGVAGDRAPRR